MKYTNTQTYWSSACATSGAALIGGALLWSMPCGGEKLHIPMNGWKWYLQGSRECVLLRGEAQLKEFDLGKVPVMKHGAEFGFLDAKENVQHLRLVLVSKRSVGMVLLPLEKVYDLVGGGVLS